MKKIKLSISGYLGRMGQQLIKSSKNVKNFKLISVTENRFINKKVSGLRPKLNSESAFKNTNIIIDFTVPKCTLEILKIASKLKKRVVIGTTGFSKKEEKMVKKPPPILVRPCTEPIKIKINFLYFKIFFLKEE